MNYIQQITKIRERGQLTVPQVIRKALRWSDDVLVKLETMENGFKVERLPISHPQNPVKKLSDREWDKILRDMKKISKIGKKTVNLTGYLRKDRDTHL